MKIVMWLLIVVFGGLALLNFPGLQPVQNWVFGNFEFYIKILYIVMSIFALILGGIVLNDFRLRFTILWVIVSIAFAIFAAYAGLQPDITPDPDVLPDFHQPGPQKVFAVTVALMYTISGIIGQMPSKAKKT